MKLLDLIKLNYIFLDGEGGVTTPLIHPDKIEIIQGGDANFSESVDYDLDVEIQEISGLRFVVDDRLFNSYEYYVYEAVDLNKL